MDVLEEVEGKVIIWANYIYDIEKIVKCIIKKIWRRVRCRLLWCD